MPASNLIERVAELVDSGIATVPPAARPQLEALGRRLREPVRLAVVGRVNAGKSTLVNALLGRRVAPTDVSECTRLVTWFRYGRPERVDVELDDGSMVAEQLSPDGTLPNKLDVPLERVQALHCYLANEVLRTMTLIDTPGIGSVHEEFSAVTERLLATEHDSTDAASRADAVVFLFNQVVMEDEMQALQLFKTGSQIESSQSAANAVGVLSKADQLGDGSSDPWGIALELADRYADKFRDDVATVVPVVGLIAETSETAGLTETDATHIAALAAMEEKAFKRLTWSADRFVSAEAPVPPEARERLLALLDLYGLERVVAFAREGAAGAVALRRQLSTISGIAEVKRTLSKYFSEQDHVLKVRSVLDLLRRISFVGEGADPAMRRFAGEVEELRLDPVMHPVAELEVLHDCLTRRVVLPDETLDEVTRLLSAGSVASRLGTDPDDREAAAAAAKDGMLRWRTFMVAEADPGQARVARVILRSYQLMWKDLQDDST
jgi:GTPase Era involved in 16S rRNA processing